MRCCDVGPPTSFVVISMVELSLVGGLIRSMPSLVLSWKDRVGEARLRVGLREMGPSYEKHCFAILSKRIYIGGMRFQGRT